MKASDGAADNSSYSAIRVTTDNLGLFANTTGGWMIWLCAVSYMCAWVVV
jgi:hypothetical protein